MFNELAFSIVLQAIEDYKLLLEYDVDYIVDDHTLISRAELEEFFNSEWCDGLLSLMSNLTGKAILRHLKK